MKHDDVVIVSAARTAVGKLGGSLLKTDEAHFGSEVIKAAMQRAGIEHKDVDELVFGQNFRTGLISSNSTRVLAHYAGFGLETPEFTLNKHCAGALKAITYAYQAIKSQTADCIISGGVDQMSKAAFFAPANPFRWGGKMGHMQLIDQLVMRDPVANVSTIDGANNTAKVYGISREEQDAFAMMSENRAEAAIKNGNFKDQIVPITIKDRKKGEFIFDTDECPTFGTTMESLGKLRTVSGGDTTVTAGNSSGLSDGAGAFVIMSGKKCMELGLKPMAKIVAFDYVGCDPALFTLGPVLSTRRILAKTGLTIDDFDVMEINEAFAAQMILYMREINPNIDKMNPNGGAVALGHPIGATGAIIMTKLLYELEKRNGQLGLVSMCIGGGQGMSIIVDRNV